MQRGEGSLFLSPLSICSLDEPPFFSPPRLFPSVRTNKSIVNYLVQLKLIFSCRLGVKECQCLITLGSRRAPSIKTAYIVLKDAGFHNSLICQGTLQPAYGYLLGCILCPLFSLICWTVAIRGCSNIWLKCEKRA